MPPDYPSFITPFATRRLEASPRRREIPIIVRVPSLTYKESPHDRPWQNPAIEDDRGCPIRSRSPGAYARGDCLAIARFREFLRAGASVLSCQTLPPRGHSEEIPARLVYVSWGDNPSRIGLLSRCLLDGIRSIFSRFSNGPTTRRLQPMSQFIGV